MKGKRTTRQIEHLLPRIREILKSIYGNTLVEVILYGSFARNTPNEDSDIDIAVVLKGKVNKAKEINKIYDAVYDLMLETGELISVFPISEHEVGNSVWPLYHHIRTEGKKI
ncbi:MAG: nucleotidyltransferase domain-containing protein [candidate division Zixibacteria bacterium]|nr:nucleotidyltransferase domain-containing protein [candidate division Zixibacteria bacterium]